MQSQSPKGVSRYIKQNIRMENRVLEAWASQGFMDLRGGD